MSGAVLSQAICQMPWKTYCSLNQLRFNVNGELKLLFVFRLTVLTVRSLVAGSAVTREGVLVVCAYTVVLTRR